MADAMTNLKGAYKTTFLNAELRASLAHYLATHPGETYSSLVQRLLRDYFAQHDEKA